MSDTMSDTTNENRQEQKEKQQQWHHMATVHELEGLKRRIDITYDAEAVQMAFDKATSAVGKQVMIKGFRRGKAPKAIVENFCRDEIKKAASSMLSQEGYLHAVFENKLSPMSKPDVKDAMFHTDGTFSCSITVEVRPDIQLGGYVGLELTKPAIDVEKIAQGLREGLRDRYSRLEAREKAEPGAMVKVDYRVTLDDVVLTDMESQAFMIMPDGGSPLGDSLSGMAVGEVREEKMTLPSDFGEHAGKEADVRIALREASMPVRPSDEELAASAMKDDDTIKSPEDLQARIDQHAAGEAAKRVRQALEGQVVEKLLDMHEFEVPQKWVDDEMRYLLSQLNVSKPDEQILNSVRELAHKNVRRTFIMDAIYEAEQKHLGVRPEEIKQFLLAEAKRLGMPEIALRKKIIKQNMMDSIVGSIRNKKIMDFLLANAHVVDEGAQSGPEGETKGDVIEIMPPSDEPAEERVIEVLPPQDD